MTGTAAPSLAELEATLKDQSKIAALLRDPEKFGDFVSDYAAAKTKAADPATLEQQVKEQAQKVLADMLRDNGVQAVQRLNLDRGQGVNALIRGKNKLYNAKAPGALIDKDYQGSAEYLQSIWHHVNTLPNGGELQAKTNEWRKIQNSFGSTVPADGGFLIPETLRSELLSVALESSIVRPLARIIPMDSLRVPIPTIDDTSHASSVFGGIVAYWTEEGATLTESQASFGTVKLEAKKLTAYCEVPNELVTDAPAFGAFLDQILPEAIAWYEDDGFINGSGVGMPLGFLKGQAAVSVTRATASTVKFADIVNMYTRMLPGSLNRAVWICSPAVIAQLLQLVLTVAAGDSVSPPLWLSGGQLFGAPVMQLLGRPLIVSEKVPNLGSAGDITFVDLGYYLIGDRQVMQALSSPHFKFASDKTAYRIIERVDGRPWLSSAITPKNGGPTLSPIVKLAA